LKVKPKEYTVREEGSRGFALRVRPSGSKTFLYIRKKHGRVCKKTLGVFPDISVTRARSLWEKAREEPIVFKKPEPKPESETLTLKQGWRIFERDRKSEMAARSLKTYADIIYEVADHFGDRPLCSFTPEELEKYTYQLDDLFAVKGNRAKAVLSSLYKHLRRKRKITCRNPMSDVEYVPEKVRTRKLTKAELKALLRRINNSQLRDETLTAIKLALLTGQRTSEICHIRAEEVDLEARRWVLPPERCKNRREHLVPLSEPAAAILAPYLEKKFSGPLLLGIKGGELSIHSPRVALRRFAEELGMENVNMHDLRRTVAHLMNAEGVKSDVIIKILNHSPLGVTFKHYIQVGLYDDEEVKREALDMWSKKLVGWGLNIATTRHLFSELTNSGLPDWANLYKIHRPVQLLMPA
jgi:integrase